MKKKYILIISVILIVISFVTLACAQGIISITLNGKILNSDVSPVISQGRVLVPIRVVAEALGADVKWDDKNKNVSIESKKDAQEDRISQLEAALAPTNPDDAVNMWAKAVKERNGAIEYAVYSEDMKNKAYDCLVSWQWHTGVSSPWVESFKVLSKTMQDDKTYKYDIQFFYASSTGPSSSGRSTVIIKQKDSNWFVDDVNGVRAKNAVVIEDQPENAPKIKEIEKRYSKEEKILRIIQFNKKYVLIESQRDTYANRFDLYNLETGDRDVLPTETQIIALGEIISENEIVFLASGRNSESAFRTFPYYIRCVRDKEDSKSETDFKAMAETRYFGLGDDGISFGDKEWCSLSWANMNDNNVNLVFTPKTGSELGFYADYSNIPPASTEFIKDKWQLVLHFKNCNIDDKLIKDLGTLSSNKQVKSIQGVNDGRDSKIIINLDKDVREYTCSVKTIKSDNGQDVVNMGVLFR